MRIPRVDQFWPRMSLVLVSLLITACGGGGSGSTPESAVGTPVAGAKRDPRGDSGTAANVKGTGLLLQINGGNDVSIPAGAEGLTFPTLPEGTAYKIAIKSQPSGQSCTLSRAAGIVGSDNVTDVAVTCMGLDPRNNKQSFQSLTANLRLRASYTVNLRCGVIIPYLGGDYVRELQRNVEVFNVRFASDPADPTPPIEVRANDPDQSYWRLTGGLSAQLPSGISGYVKYQRLQGFELVHFTDLAVGPRMQYSLK